MALAGVAMGADVSITLPEKTDFNWVAGTESNIYATEDTNTTPASSLTTTSVTANNIVKFATYLSTNETDLSGWYGGTQGGHDSNSTQSSDISIADSGFTFNSRSGIGGEYVAMGISKEINATSITLTFSADNNVACSLWSYNTQEKTATCLSKVDATMNGTLSYTESVLDTSQIFVVWGSRPSEGALNGANPITVTNVSLQYAPAIPEPATATLSLLALVGLAARRRRK